jgi:hypothetical protein
LTGRCKEVQRAHNPPATGTTIAIAETIADVAAS